MVLSEPVRPRGGGSPLRRAAICRGLAGTLIAWASAAASAAPAFAREGSKDVIGACLDNHTRGQELRLAGDLLESRQTFLRCSASSCPNQIQRDCLNWLEQIQVQIPSIGFRVTADGKSRADVQVFIDGELVLEKWSGKAVEVNPGPHELRVVLEPYPPFEQSVVASEGDRFRVVEVAFSTQLPEEVPEAPRPPEMHRPVPGVSYVFGALGAAAAISGAAWGVSSWALRRDLEENCAPRCSESRIDSLRRRALVADISWGVSAASLVTASLFYLFRPERPVDDRVNIDLACSPQGAMGVLRLEGW